MQLALDGNLGVLASFRQLDRNLSHQRKENLNWEVISSRLFCGRVCGGVFLMND